MELGRKIIPEKKGGRERAGNHLVPMRLSKLRGPREELDTIQIGRKGGDPDKERNKSIWPKSQPSRNLKLWVSNQVPQNAESERAIGPLSARKVGERKLSEKGGSSQDHWASKGESATSKASNREQEKEKST